MPRIRGSGERYRRVTIQRLEDGVGDSGFPIQTVASSYPWHASRDEMFGEERFMAEQTTAKADTRWQGAYRPDLDPELVDVPKVRRMVYQGRTYDIVAARVIGQKKAIELVTLAKVG